MANYQLAYKQVGSREGIYAKDPCDRGWETYKGISRRFWPSWPGWRIVDAYKRQVNFPQNLLADKQLDTLVFLFYKQNFWDKIGGDMLRSQRIANLLCDSAVNEGVSAGIKRAQLLCGLPQTGIVNSLLINKLNMLI